MNSILDIFKSKSSQLEEITGKFEALQSTHNETLTKFAILLLENEETKAELNKLTDISKENVELKNTLTEIENELKQAEKSSAVKATQFVSSVGIDPLPLNKVDTAAMSSILEIQEKFHSIKDNNEKAEFYAKHRDTILNNL